MLLQIPQVLNAEQLRAARDKLAAAGNAWVDGRVTAGHQGAQVDDSGGIPTYTSIGYRGTHRAHLSYYAKTVEGVTVLKMAGQAYPTPTPTTKPVASNCKNTFRSMMSS